MRMLGDGLKQLLHGRSGRGDMREAPRYEMASFRKEALPSRPATRLVAAGRTMRPIIVVAGWMRSGSTMMMRCLEAGGVPICYTAGSEDLELSKGDYAAHYDPQRYEGKALKSLRVGPERLYPWPGGYKIIFMERPAREQQASWFKKSGADVVLETIEYQTDLSLAYAANRRDAEVMVVEYHDCLERPRELMQAIGDFIERPDFDVEAAAAVVDPDLKHFDINDMQGVSLIEEGDPVLMAGRGA